jgi:hypothetical protein
MILRKGCRFRVLKRIFGPRTDEVLRRLLKLHNNELHNSNSSPSTIRIIKSGRMRLSGHVVGMGKGGMHKGFWCERQKKRDN